MRKSAWAALWLILIVMAEGGGQSGAPAAPVTPGEGITVALRGGATMEMVSIPAGTFRMGSLSSEPGRNADEDLHEVVIPRKFYMGKYEITQRQWESVMGTRPWAGKKYVQENPDHPAVYVSWDDAQEFLKKLNERAPLYRLPTEAEWEYACRAGTGTRWVSGDDEARLGKYAWYYGNIEERHARAVGMKLPNPWGLCDTHGNVWEWVQDSYVPYPGGHLPEPSSDPDRVDRGGSFYDPARRLRSAYRNHDAPSCRSADMGLRLVRQER